MKDIHRMIGRVFVGMLISCNSVITHAQTGVGVEVGVRTDYLRWNIADPDAAVNMVNILSELSWRNVDSHYVNAHVAFKEGDLNVRGDLGYGQITRGYNQDSDYNGNNRTLEFSRSNNKTSGDQVNDVKLGFGIDFADITLSNFQFTPWFGLSRHQQNLRMTNAVQTIPAIGPFDGLNSTYKAQWTGPWVGFNARLQVDPSLTIRVNFEHHLTEYSGQGNWNLRDCLAHPKSFSHESTGDGDYIDLSAEFALETNITLTLSMADSSWSTGSGTDTVHLPADFYTRRDSEGQLVCIGQVVQPEDQVFNFSVPLNEVKWSSRSYLAGVNVRL